jgi:hypothetical protein
LVDTQDSKSCAYGHLGSTPSASTDILIRGDGILWLNLKRRDERSYVNLNSLFPRAGSILFTTKLTLGMLRLVLHSSTRKARLVRAQRIRYTPRLTGSLVRRSVLLEDEREGEIRMGLEGLIIFIVFIIIVLIVLRAFHIL